MAKAIHNHGRFECSEPAGLVIALRRLARFGWRARRHGIEAIEMSRTKRFLCGVGVVAAILVAAARSASATVIEFQATDLTDLVSGDDLWMYRYFVSDFVFAADQGFSISFDTALYRNLQDPPPSVGADWDLLAIQPDLALPSAGLYDALALVDGASLAQSFTLSFTWLGVAGSEPGSQAFTVNQFDAAGNIILPFLEVGQTIPFGQTSLVPEPSTLLLVGSGLALALRRRRRPQRTGASSGDWCVRLRSRFLG
jgi:hypothetical protein